MSALLSTAGSDPPSAVVARPAVRAQLLLFAATLFLSSFLMFLVEPMIAKTVLPILGGAPMVWNTCVLFFQIMLLAGYACAQLANSWHGSRRQAVFYGTLLIVPLFILPFTIPANAARRPDVNPILWLLTALTTAIGLPFFVLSTSASMFQRLFSQTDDPAARDPYFLYSASNLGSLLALVAYPALVEPRLRLAAQSRLWAIGYAIFVILGLICVGFALRQARSGRTVGSREIERSTTDLASDAALSYGRRIKWVALSFIPSSLMLAVTSYLSTDIAAVPLLWIVPLSLYLMSFVVVFGGRGLFWRKVSNNAMPWLIMPLALMTSTLSVALWLVVPLHLLAFGSVAFFCHGELASDRPPASQLTEFYFWIALGGALGGLFNTLAAPLLFNSVVEYPLVLVLACLFRARVRSDAGSRRRPRTNILAPLIGSALAAGIVVSLNGRNVTPGVLLAAVGLPVLVYFIQFQRPVHFALSVGAMLLIGSFVANRDVRLLHAERTFFGVYRVSVDRAGRYRSLINGTTLHGRQAVDETRQDEPLTYYHRTGPFGQAFGQLPLVSGAPQIAAVGLGVGSLATYARPGQHWTFYEIDPAVERMAAEYFTYLRSCGDRCQVVLGDARLSLTDAQPNSYGLIVLDAFSSDAIPIHLLTSEAMALYLERLAPAGVLAFHISNRYLSLGPVLARLALAHGLTAIEQMEQVPNNMTPDGKTSSDWILMTRDRQDFGSLLSDNRWATPAVSGSTPLWTDDFSNILSVLRLGSPLR